MASSPLRLQLMITVAMALHTTMAAAAVQPHLLFVLVDDLGFNGVGAVRRAYAAVGRRGSRSCSEVVWGFGRGGEGVEAWGYKC